MKDANGTSAPGVKNEHLMEYTPVVSVVDANRGWYHYRIPLAVEGRIL